MVNVTVNATKIANLQVVQKQLQDQLAALQAEQAAHAARIALRGKRKQENAALMAVRLGGGDRIADCMVSNWYRGKAAVLGLRNAPPKVAAAAVKAAPTKEGAKVTLSYAQEKAIKAKVSDLCDKMPAGTTLTTNEVCAAIGQDLGARYAVRAAMKQHPRLVVAIQGGAWVPYTFEVR